MQYNLVLYKSLITDMILSRANTIFSPAVENPEESSPQMAITKHPYKTATIAVIETTEFNGNDPEADRVSHVSNISVNVKHTGVIPSSIEVPHGRLAELIAILVLGKPGFYICPKNFWLQTMVYWRKSIA